MRFGDHPPAARIADTVRGALDGVNVPGKTDM